MNWNMQKVVKMSKFWDFFADESFPNGLIGVWARHIFEGAVHYPFHAKISNKNLPVQLLENGINTTI